MTRIASPLAIHWNLSPGLIPYWSAMALGTVNCNLFVSFDISLTIARIRSLLNLATNVESLVVTSFNLIAADVSNAFPPGRDLGWIVQHSWSVFDLLKRDGARLA